MKQFIKRTSILMLTFLLVLVGMPIEAIGEAVETNVVKATVNIKNSSRTESITIAYDGFSEEVKKSNGIDFHIPVGTLVTITVNDKGTTPFPGAVKVEATNINGKETLPTNYNNQFYFKAGKDYENLGIITEVTSWKEDDGVYDILSVESFADKYVEYGTQKDQLNLPTEVTVTFNDEIPFSSGPTVIDFPITWDDGTPNYQGSENALFSARIDGEVDHSTYTIDLMVYVLFYDLVDIESFSDIEQPYSTVFTLPQEADVVLDQWYLKDGSKNFTETSKNDTFEIDFYDAPGLNTGYELRNDVTYNASPTLPVYVFNPDGKETTQRVLPLYLQIAKDLDLGRKSYLPGESEPSPPNVGDAPLDNNSTYPLNIDWDMDNPQITDPDLGPRVKVYTGTWILNEGITNPENYKVSFTSEMEYWIIEDDVTLSYDDGLVGDPQPVLPDYVDTPIVDNGLQLVGVEWGQPSISETNDYRIYSYTGEFVLYDGLLNPELYQVFAEISHAYNAIQSDVDLGVHEFAYGSSEPNRPNPVSTPLIKGDNRDFIVDWTLVSSEMIVDIMIRSYEGNYNNLPDGVKNPGSYQAFFETHEKYLVIVDVINPPLIDVAEGTPYDDINLPDTVQVEYDDGSFANLPVNWSQGNYDGINNLSLEGELSLPDGVLNLDELYPLQAINIYTQRIIDAVDPAPVVVAPGTLLSDIIPEEAMAYFTDPALDGNWSVNFGSDFAITSDMLVRGDFDNLPAYVGNPDDIHVNQEITVQKVVITESEDAEVESSGLTLRIGHNRSVAEGQAQLYYRLLPYFELDQDDEVLWSVVEGSSTINLTDKGFVQGLGQGEAKVKITIKYGQDNENTLEDLITINVIEYAPPTPQKVVITESEDAEVESSGLTLRIGYNRSVAEGQAQLYYRLLPGFELDQDDEVVWSIESGSSYIDLSNGGFVQGVDQGEAKVKITVKYGQDNENTLEDLITIKVIEYAQPSTPPTPQTLVPFITLDRNRVELEYGTDALEELFSYDFTERIFNSNDSRVEWFIEDEEIASVDENGLVEAVSAGETRVTVRHVASGASASATVVVFLVGEEENPLGAVEFFAPYIVGYPDQTFGPQRPVTRAEVATMFARILSLNLDFPGTPKYKDVSESTWFYKYIQAATRAGLFSGYADGSFRPDAPMTRGEIATVFSKYWDFLDMRVDSLPTDALADVDGSHWASDYIYKIYNAGIVKGFEDGTFRPDTNTLREQVVGMINTLINRPEFFPESTKYVDIPKNHWAFGNIEAATTPYSALENSQVIDEAN